MTGGNSPGRNLVPSETTCHIKLKIFLWTKLLKNLLPAKYLISVAAPLTSKVFSLSLLMLAVVQNWLYFTILYRSIFARRYSVNSGKFASWVQKIAAILLFNLIMQRNSQNLLLFCNASILKISYTKCDILVWVINLLPQHKESSIFSSLFKGTLMQIRKSGNIFVFIWK